VVDKPPPWEDLDADDNGLAAVYLWVQAKLDLPENKELKDDLIFFPSGVRPRPPKVDLGTALQRQALREARIGNRHRLANLVWNSRSFNGVVRPQQPLNNEVRQFIAEFLVKPSTGTGRRGRPPNPEHQLNRQRTKRHAEVFQILLQRDYPERSDAEIKNRAIDLVYASFSRGSQIKRDTIANLFVKKANKVTTKT
jgi:hypothetical protein